MNPARVSSVVISVLYHIHESSKSDEERQFTQESEFKRVYYVCNMTCFVLSAGQLAPGVLGARATVFLRSYHFENTLGIQCLRMDGRPSDGVSPVRQQWLHIRLWRSVCALLRLRGKIGFYFYFYIYPSEKHLAVFRNQSAKVEITFDMCRYGPPGFI